MANRPNPQLCGFNLVVFSIFVVVIRLFPFSVLSRLLCPSTFVSILEQSESGLYMGKGSREATPTQASMFCCDEMRIKIKIDISVFIFGGEMFSRLMIRKDQNHRRTAWGVQRGRRRPQAARLVGGPPLKRL
jgi:hypothetical protein